MRNRKVLTMKPVLCNNCKKTITYRLTYHPEKPITTKILCKECYKPEVRCHMGKCNGKPVAKTEIPALYGDYNEVWYYCEKHSYMVEVNGAIDLAIPKAIKEAIEFAKSI